MDVLYDAKESAMFDSVATMLSEMSEQEKRDFMIMIQCYRAGVSVGKRLAEHEQRKEAQ